MSLHSCHQGEESALAQLQPPKLRVRNLSDQVEQIFHTIHVESHLPKYTRIYFKSENLKRQMSIGLLLEKNFTGGGRKDNRPLFFIVSIVLSIIFL